jgi:hypothetical protein
MEAKNFIQNLPSVSDHLAIETLTEVLYAQVNAQFRDFVEYPRPDHPLVNLVMLIKWLSDLPPGPADHRLRWVKE